MTTYNLADPHRLHGNDRRADNIQVSIPIQIRRTILTVRPVTT